jgi:5-methylcytosine-specific restriction endonuclease McrA
MKKKSNWTRNPKHRYYVSLLNPQEWQGINGLRARTLRAHPLCQLCEKEGIVASAVDVHHLNPVEGVGGRYVEGDVLPEPIKEAMRQRCFDPNNVIALCIPCHIRIHKEMLRSHVGQMRDLPNMPHEEQKQEPTALGSFAQRMTGETYQPKPKPMKGIRRTPLGWMTPEEFKEKQKQNLDKWKENLTNGFTNIEGTASVDAATED